MIRPHRFWAGLAVAGLLVSSGFLAAQQPPAPVFPAPQAPEVNPAPVAKHRPTGARSSRHHWLAYQATRHPLFVHQPAAAPAQFTPAVILSTSQMSYWGNDQFGDCVSAEEAFAKDIYPVYYAKTGTPVLLSTSTVTSWARRHGYLNGADLTSVMDDMIKDGMADNGVTYTDGPYTSVDYTNWQTLCSAIYQGPVKIGVAAGQLQSTPGVGSQNGWVATGYRHDGNEDHCTSLCGYGTMQYLCSAMGVGVPSGVDPTSNAVLFFTWDTIGVMDYKSLLNITGEAWLRTPTTPQTPVTPPGPNPNPTPTPGAYAWTLNSPPSGAAVDPSGNFTWAIPASQPPGSVSISFTVTSTAGSATASFTVNVTAAGAVTIAPIPAQAAAAGSTLSLNLGQYVTTTNGPHGPGH